MLFIVFMLGLIVGSFLNVAILRGARGESLGGRSYCPQCKTRLQAKELIPVLSFLIQKGRCLHCGTALSRQYPLVEIATALLYSLAFLKFPGEIFPPNLQSIILLLGLFIGLGATIVIVVSDFKFQIIPNGAVIILILLGILRTVAAGSNLWYDAGGALILSLFVAALWFFSRGRWMGLGDAKLILAASLILGFPASLAAFLFSFWLGGIAGAILLVLHRKKLTSRLPFGPFIILGTMLAYFLSVNFLLLTGLNNLL